MQSAVDDRSHDVQSSDSIRGELSNKLRGREYTHIRACHVSRRV